MQCWVRGTSLPHAQEYKTEFLLAKKQEKPGLRPFKIRNLEVTFPYVAAAAAAAAPSARDVMGVRVCWDKQTTVVVRRRLNVASGSCRNCGGREREEELDETITFQMQHNTMYSSAGRLLVGADRRRQYPCFLAPLRHRSLPFIFVLLFC